MASETQIDKLSIEVEGNAKSAEQSVDKLIESLGKLKESFEDAYKIVKQPLNIKTQIENADEASKLQYSVQKAIDGVKPNTSALAKKIANDFGITGKKQMSEIRKSLDNMVKGFADTLTNGFDQKKLKENMQEFGSALMKNGSLTADEIESYKSMGTSIQALDEELLRFYRDYKNVKLYVSKGMYSEIKNSGGDFEELRKKSLRNITSDKNSGIDVNRTWSELTSQYPTLFGQDTINEAEQLYQVLKQLQRARDEIKPISISDMTDGQKKDVAKYISDYYKNTYADLKGVFENIQSEAQKASDGKIILDVIVDEAKIVQQVEAGIRNASAKEYDPIKIKVKLNLESLEQQVTSLNFEKLSGLSNLNLNGVAESIKNFAGAMTIFKQSAGMADFTRIANGLEKISAINSSGLSASADAIKKLGTNLSALGTIQFDSVGLQNMANSISAFGRKTVTQAVSNIPQITQAFSTLVQSMSQLNTTQINTAGFTELSNAIARLGGKNSMAAPANIREIGVALRDLMTTLGQAPKVSQDVLKLVNSLSQLSGRARKIPELANSTNRGFMNMSNGAKSATRTHHSLAAAIGKVYATYWMLFRAMGLFRKAINISSDLTEVQNVVNTVFGNMSGAMEKFAQESMYTIGMSELTAKQVGSRFQAMGVALGKSQEEMTSMSLALTKLTGDMASFYNVAQSDVAKDLESIFTGQTRPLMLAA